MLGGVLPPRYVGGGGGGGLGMAGAWKWQVGEGGVGEKEIRRRVGRAGWGVAPSVADPAAVRLDGTPPPPPPFPPARPPPL